MEKIIFPKISTHSLKLFFGYDMGKSHDVGCVSVCAQVDDTIFIIKTVFGTDPMYDHWLEIAMHEDKKAKEQYKQEKKPNE